MSSATLRATPPHDLALERALLGCLLRAGPRGDYLLDRLRPADLYRLQHQQILAALREIRATGAVPDLPLLAGRLRAAGVESPEAVAVEIEGITPTAANLDRYAEGVLTISRLRAGAAACGQYLERVEGSPDDGAALGDLAAELATIQATGARDETTEELIEDELGALSREAKATSAAGTPGITTGYETLDARLGGWRQGLTFVAGWTSSGKSALLVRSLRAAAIAGARWRLYSVDMAPRSWWRRMVQQQLKIGRRRAMRMDLTETETAALYALPAGLLSRGCIFVRQKRTLSDIIADARRFSGTFGMLVLDTWQSLRWDDSRSAYDRVCDGVVRLKALANELGVPVVCTMQAGEGPRRHELAKGEVPPAGINDLEGGRRLSQEAAVVLVVHRSDYGAASDEVRPVPAVVRIVKDQTSGCTGEIPMRWLPDFGAFEETGAAPERARASDGA